MKILRVLSLISIAWWWTFLVIWNTGFVHTIARNDSPAIDRAIEYATRGTTQFDDIYFTHNEVSHLVDVSHIYRIVSTALNILSIASWLVLLWSVYKKEDLSTDLRVSAKILAILIALAGIAIMFFSSSFEWFHRLLFPQGNWAFPANSMLITLFPEDFWRAQVLCIMGLLCAFACLYWYLSTPKHA